MEMLKLRVYKDFILQDILPYYSYLKWTRRFCDLPEFELKMPFDLETYNLLTLDTVVYNEFTKEACFVNRRAVYRESNGSYTLHIKGVGVADILDYRVAVIDMTASPEALVKSLINSNFVSPSISARRVPGFALGTMAVSNNTAQTLLYDRHTSVQTILHKLLQELYIGYRVRYDLSSKQYIFDLYEGNAPAHVVFSQDYRNISSQSIYHLGDDYKNVVYVGADDAEKETTVTIVGSAGGLNRRETAISSDTNESDTTTGNNLLKEHQISTSADLTIDTNSQSFTYRNDWDLGDIVRFKDEDTGVNLLKNITEITETYELGRVSLDVTLGDYLRR